MKNSLLPSDKLNMTDTNLCINCPSKQQETLFHYVFKCPKYQYYRNNFLQQIETIAKLKYLTDRNLLNLLLNDNKSEYLQKTEYIYTTNKFKKDIEKTKRFV